MLIVRCKRSQECGVNVDPELRKRVEQIKSSPIQMYREAGDYSNRELVEGILVSPDDIAAIEAVARAGEDADAVSAAYDHDPDDLWRSSGEFRASLTADEADDAHHRMVQPDHYPSSREPFAHYDPATSSWRTSQDSWLDTEGWGTSLAIWPSSGMTRTGTAFPLPPSVPRTSAIASGSLPTPTASDAKASGAAGYSTSSGRHSGTTLTDAVVRWPTPTARHWKDGSYNANVPINGLLGRAVWQTPSAADADGGHRRRGGTRSDELLLSGQAQHADGVTTGSLNPTWVEWLMGFPLGWTDCEHLATRSSRKSSK
jgi:hypothetical protein